MIGFWPKAITLVNHYGKPDDAGMEKTRDACSTLLEAWDQFDVWEREHGAKIIKRWVEVTETGKPKTVRDVHVHFGRVKDLWTAFTQVRFDPVTEGLEKAWGSFPVCTPKKTILVWFEQTFSVNIEEQLLGHEDEIWSCGNRFRVVKHVRYPEYRIWNTGSMVEGYLPLFRKKPDPSHDGREKIGI